MKKNSPYSHPPVYNDIQSTSNNDVLRSLLSTADKIDLFVIKTKLSHYWE